MAVSVVVRRRLRSWVPAVGVLSVSRVLGLRPSAARSKAWGSRAKTPVRASTRSGASSASSRRSPGEARAASWRDTPAVSSFRAPARPSLGAQNPRAVAARHSGSSRLAGRDRPHTSAGRGAGRGAPAALPGSTDTDPARANWDESVSF